MDSSEVVVPGIVLVRQKPGSAKGVMFITIEDEMGVVSLVPWADRLEKQRRLVLSAGMIACHGRVRLDGQVIHVVTDRLEDLSALLRSVIQPHSFRFQASWRHASCGAIPPDDFLTRAAASGWVGPDRRSVGHGGA